MAKAKAMNIKEIQAEEEFIVDVQYAIQKLLNESGVSYAHLAKKLGVSAARVSQMFGDEAHNLTLRTVARIFHVLNDKCVISSDLLKKIAEKGKKEKALIIPLCAMAREENIPVQFIGAIMRSRNSEWISATNQNEERPEAA